MVEYSKELAEAICDSISIGGNLNDICKGDGMPERKSVYRWLIKIPEFRDMYEAALLARLETKQEEFRETIANTQNNAPAIKKLEIWIKQEIFFMGKINPKKYGDRMTLAGDKENPLTVNLAAFMAEKIAQRDNDLKIQQQTIDGSFQIIEQNQGDRVGVCAPIEPPPD